jgi:hypothetical protein
MMICIKQKTIDRFTQDIIPANTAKQNFLIAAGDQIPIALSPDGEWMN